MSKIYIIFLYISNIKYIVLVFSPGWGFQLYTNKGTKDIESLTHCGCFTNALTRYWLQGMAYTSEKRGLTMLPLPPPTQPYPPSQWLRPPPPPPPSSTIPPSFYFNPPSTALFGPPSIQPMLYTTPLPWHFPTPQPHLTSLNPTTNNTTSQNPTPILNPKT